MKIMVLHMGRSGGHAVIEWICRNLDGRVVFGNNCINGWDRQEFIPNKAIKEYKNNDDNTIHIVKSIEDFHLPLWERYKMNKWEKFDVILTVIRRPSNWLASSIAAKGFANEYLDKPPENSKELSVSRIEAFLVYCNNLFNNKYLKYNQTKVSPILYDKLIEHDKYRGTASFFIGLDELVNEMPEHCKFSSFGKNYNYTGNRYNLLNKRQKKRFDKLFVGELKLIEDKLFEKQNKE